MRLIDGDRLEDVIKDECLNYSGESNFILGLQNGLLIARDIVQEAPTIDAEPVVRCKDCKYCNGEYEDCYFDIFVKPDGYCSYGEKTEVEE